MYIIQSTVIKSESKIIQWGHDVTTTGCHQYLIKKKMMIHLFRSPTNIANFCRFLWL